MNMKHLALAAAALLVSGSAASAAVVTNPLHLRAGPGAHYRVIDTMPAGAHVAIKNCSGSWCHVRFRGEMGYASANYLGQNRGRARNNYRGYRAYAQTPGYYDNGYDEGPGIGVGIGPFGFGMGFGPGWGYHYHRGEYGYHHGWHRY